jgi:hypothetical protein
MKQIWLGMAQYVQDYDERFPFQTSETVQNSANSTSGSWISKVMLYIKSHKVFICPSAKPSISDPPYDLIGRMYRQLDLSFKNTTDERIRARLIDLVLYTRYVEIYLNYSCSGADE